MVENPVVGCCFLTRNKSYCTLHASDIITYTVFFKILFHYQHCLPELNVAPSFITVNRINCEN